MRNAMSKDLLSRHHEDLDRRIASLVARAYGGDVQALASEWDRFERDLLEHFAIEEREVLPRFARDQPEEAAALRHEHAALRRDLLALGIRADLHFLRADAVTAFVGDLRAHAAHEESVLYPWARTRLDRGAWDAMAERLRSAKRVATDALSELGARTM
jgi:hemerythrin-like domain-containing protein